MKQKDYEKFRIGCEMLEQSGADFILAGDAGDGRCYEAGRSEDIPGDLLFIAVCEFMASRLKEAEENKFQTLIELQIMVNKAVDMVFDKDNDTDDLS